MNENQFGFRPQKSTIDAAMAIKDCSRMPGRMISNSASQLGRPRRIRRSIVAGDSEGTKRMRMSKNLYELTKSYFTQRTATLSTNCLRTENGVSRKSPQGSCCGPGFWNFKYNSLLEIKYMAQTKVVAFAEDLMMATTGESVRAVENYVNVEPSIINV
jgi:hypothetical protein